MLSSSSAKLFFAFAAICLSSGCWRAAKTETGAPAASFAADESKSGVPFATKEPENFQADFVITANDSETVVFAARGGANRRRFDYNRGEKNHLTILQTDARRKFLILPAQKIYAENFNSETAAPAPTTDESLRDFLTSNWLKQKPDANFARLGTENGLAKYAVRLNDASASEIIVFADERINLPARLEFYAARGEQKILTYAVEMKNFKSQADENLFAIPTDARRVSIETLRAAMRETKTDER